MLEVILKGEPLPHHVILTLETAHLNDVTKSWDECYLSLSTLSMAWRWRRIRIGVHEVRKITE
jgi:hypothetical protein